MVVASATRCVTIGAGLTAVVLIIFLYGVTDIDDADAVRKCALSYLLVFEPTEPRSAQEQGGRVILPRNQYRGPPCAGLLFCRYSAVGWPSNCLASSQISYQDGFSATNS